MKVISIQELLTTHFQPGSPCERAVEQITARTDEEEQSKY